MGHSKPMIHSVIDVLNKYSPVDLKDEILNYKMDFLVFSSIERVSLLIDIEQKFDIVIDELNLVGLDFDGTINDFILSVSKIINKEKGEI